MEAFPSAAKTRGEIDSPRPNWRECCPIARLRPQRGGVMAINTTDVGRPGAAHVESYWAATAGDEVAGCDPIAADVDTDIAIIGGGYTGLSCAYHLARDYGIKAHVLEANRIGWGCSGR